MAHMRWVVAKLLFLRVWGKTQSRSNDKKLSPVSGTLMISKNIADPSPGLIMII